MDNSLLAVRDINHKYIVVEQRNKGIQVVDNIIVQKDFERYSQGLLNRMWKYAKMSGLKEVEMRT